jgi:hypothetical protein
MTDIIPICQYCKVPLLRWGWYFEETEPVMYWYAFCCDKKRANLHQPELNIGTYLVVLPRGATHG